MRRPAGREGRKDKRTRYPTCDFAERSSAARLIDRQFSPLILGRDAMATNGNWLAMLQAVRNLGRPGIASHAIAAIDVALWDLKARLLRLPLVNLLGTARKGIPVYGSGGFTSYSLEQLQVQLSGWASRGIQRVKIKVGSNPDEDIARVRAARAAIGTDAELFVDANGAYTRKQAIRFVRPKNARAAPADAILRLESGIPSLAST